jgi:hypothetical protein
VDAFKIYVPKPEDHPTWDATAVLEAIRPEHGYFGLSAGGNVIVDEKNDTVFTPDPNGRCHFLTVNHDQAIRARQTLVDLISEPPLQLK